MLQLHLACGVWSLDSLYYVYYSCISGIIRDNIYNEIKISLYQNAHFAIMRYNKGIGKGILYLSTIKYAVLPI